MKKVAPALVAALMMVLIAACSDDSKEDPSSDGSTQETVIASMAETIAKPSGGLLTEDDATCVAAAFVEDVGVAKLTTIKAVDEKSQYVSNGALLDPATAAAYTDALLDCRDEADVLATVEKNTTASYAALTSGALGAQPVACIIKAFVAEVGVAQLFASRFLNDAGEFNPGEAYDESTANKFATALLGCVDYPRIQAQDAVARNKALSLAKLAACLRTEIDPAELKAGIVARLTAAPDADTQLAASQRKAVACEKKSRK